LDNTSLTFPDWLEIDFNGSKTISEIDVITQQDDYQNPVEPTLTQTFSLFGITSFDVQYWNGSAWTTVSGGSVTEQQGMAAVYFSSITTSKIRVVVNDGADHAFSRVVEVEAWGTPASGAGAINYVLQDAQGSTRALMNNIVSGTSTIVARHDYQAFGEELGAIGLRKTSQGYTAVDGNRQKHGLTERDDVTGLDHTWFRKYEYLSGRWSSPDPYLGSMSIGDPQSFNRYSYVHSDPVNFVDPTGLLTFLDCQRMGSYEGSTWYQCNLISLGPIIHGDPSRGGTRADTPQNDDPPSLGSHIDNVCSLLVEFTGPGYMINNGPGASDLGGRVWGLGFTVSGTVAEGGIGMFETPDPPLGGVDPDIVNPHGTWSVQQWVSASWRTYREREPDTLLWGGIATRPDAPESAFRMVDGNSFVYADFPGPGRETSAGKLTEHASEYDFDVKLIRGSQQCEVKFHVSMSFKNNRFEAHWGRR